MTDDWIVPGAQVVLERHIDPNRVGGGFDGRTTVAIIATVADKTFTVDGVRGRFGRATLATGWQTNQGVRFRWMATSAEDERGRRMLRELRLRHEGRKASASLEWLRRGNVYEFTDVALADLDATIEALAELRAKMAEVEHLR